MTSIIHVKALGRTYKNYKNLRGFFGAFSNLFDRRYDLIHAVDKISFDIEQGELVGYIGQNGAGKSTTIKMLTGLLVLTSGEVIVDGYIPWKDRKNYVKEIGAVFGQRTTLWWDLPVRDSLNLLKYICETPNRKFEKRIKQFQ